MKAPLDRERLRRFWTRFFYNLKVTPKWVILRIVLAVTVFSPWLILSLFNSWIKVKKWKRRENALRVLRNHELAFSHIDISTLKVIFLSGGVSNLNQIWEFKDQDGKPIKYFAKVFVSAGSFWAKHLSVVSPFPRVQADKIQERFAVDVISRIQLADLGVNVARLVAYDTAHHVMITEYLEGVTVDALLKTAAQNQELNEETSQAIYDCAVGLARAHEGGFSLVDTQPVNCIWLRSERKVYFTDLEFCTRQDRRIWDVGFFICFIAIRLKGDVQRKARQIFLESYQYERKLDLAKLEKTHKLLEEYLPLFRTILEIRQFTPEELFEGLIPF